MEMPDVGIDFGVIYRDPVTGFAGIAIAITYWMHGCSRVGLEIGYTEKDTGIVKSTIEWFDTDRVKNHAVTGESDLTADVIPTRSALFTGGPRDQVDPGQSSDPAR